MATKAWRATDRRRARPWRRKLAIASTDFVAADRVGVECMGVDPNWVGYMRYCGQAGLGNYDLAKIDVRGTTIAQVQKKYRLAADVDRQVRWMEPLDRGRRFVDRPARSRPGRSKRPADPGRGGR